MPLDIGLLPPLCRLLNPNLVRADADNIDIWVKPRTPGLTQGIAPRTLFSFRPIEHYSSLYTYEASELCAFVGGLKM